MKAYTYPKLSFILNNFTGYVFYDSEKLLEDVLRLDKKNLGKSHKKTILKNLNRALKSIRSVDSFEAQLNNPVCSIQFRYVISNGISLHIPNQPAFTVTTDRKTAINLIKSGYKLYKTELI